MKSVTSIIISLLLPVLLLAGKVNPEKALLVGRNFYFERSTSFRVLKYDELRAVIEQTITGSSGQELYYVVNINAGGFVLVSASDNIVPVLGYSFEGKFNRNFCNVGSWVGHYETEIQLAIDLAQVATSKTASEWDRLSRTDPANLKNLRSTTSVSPLLVSKWNQDKYYNGNCPVDPAGPGGRCYAGCVATAMGQLMYYYRFPKQGQGNYSYSLPDYGTLSADFGACTYDWSGMPTSISSENNPVAKLLFHLGVSVDMDYGPNGSGMWNHKAAYSLKTYFRYGPETRYFFRDSTTINWDSILIANLDQRKPLYYAGWAGVQSTSGHAFVCDGYQGTDYFHFNWGWGGQSDGYFYLDNLTPGGNNFNYAQEVIPMFPDTIANTYPEYCNGRTILSGIRGSIEDGSGWKSYLPNSQCSWLIAPQDPEYDSVSHIKLSFRRFNTEQGNDIVYVYDGDTTTAPLLGAFSGATLPSELISTGNKLLIVFQTNGTGNLEGWQADYESAFPVYCSGTTTLTEPSGDLSDGSGSKNYNNNSLCKWKIQPPDAGSVTLTFSSFQLTDSLDILRVYDQATSQLLGLFTGIQIPPPVTSNSGKMLLMFFTNASNVSQGWEASYSSSMVGMPENKETNDHLTVSPNPASSKIYISYFSAGPGILNIEMISTDGLLLFSKQYEVKMGQNSIAIDISKYPKSLYFLNFSIANQRFSRKILIQ